MIYLDNAATSNPKPENVLRSVMGVMRNAGANPGRAGHNLSISAGRVILAARGELAKLMGVEDPMSFVFTMNCTDALNMAIKGVARQGDHMVTTGIEHNSVIRVLKTLEYEGVIALDIVHPKAHGVVDADELIAHVRHETRLVVMTHASNVTGMVQPITEVADRLAGTGVLLLIDAAQSAGILPLNLAHPGIAMAAMPGHKGLLGPQGTGALYVRPGLLLDTLREGGTGSSSELLTQPEEMPERLESGTLNTPGIAGLFAGTRCVRRNGDAMHALERRLTARLLNGLLSTPFVTVYGGKSPIERVGVAAFNVGNMSSGAVADKLNEAGICVRGGLHCAPLTHGGLGTLNRGAVRASVGPFNTDEDIDALLEVVSALGRQTKVL